MKKIILLTAASALIGCSSSSTDSSDNGQNGQSSGTAATGSPSPSPSAMSVCGAVQDGSGSEIAANVQADVEHEPVLINSIAQLGADLQAAGYLEASFVATGFVLTSSFSMLPVAVYQCTAQSKALNDCNYFVPGEDGAGADVKTSFNGASYATYVDKVSGNGATVRSLELDGIVGDAGNLTMRMFDDAGALSSTLQTNRATDGSETYQITEADTSEHIIAKELASCAGEFDYRTVNSSGDLIEMVVQWSFTNGVTTGSGHLTETSGDKVEVTNLDW